jgi:hypothetical protein
MDAWNERPLEIAHLFNPAFCGRIVCQSIEAYKKESKTRSFPFVLTYLVLPIILHTYTRSLIASSAVPMHTWIEKNPDVRVSFAERVRELMPITQESLMFVLQTHVVTVSDEGNLDIVPKHRKSDSTLSDEIKEILKKATILGRWFARAGNTTTIFTTWGVKP